MQSTSTVTDVQPFNWEENKLVIHLDKLNKFLEPYKLRISSLDDIQIDREMTALNQGDVVKIYTQKSDSDGVWDTAVEKWFFEEIKELEDKFESESTIVSSAEIDRGDLIITLVLNKQGIELDKKFEAGGALAPDKEIEDLVDQQLKNSTEHIFKMLNIETPQSQEDLDKKLADARVRAIEMYKSQRPKPLFVFVHGRKINVASGPTHETAYLQKLFYDKFHEHAIVQLNGSHNPTFANNYASSKSILAIDQVLGMATQRGQALLHLTDGMIEDMANKLVQ